MDDLHGITPGMRFLSATGRLWTVRSITPTGTRVMLTSDESDGQHGAMVDLGAIRRMVRVDQADATPTADAATGAASSSDLIRS